MSPTVAIDGCRGIMSACRVMSVMAAYRGVLNSTIGGTWQPRHRKCQRDVISYGFSDERRSAVSALGAASGWLKMAVVSRRRAPILAYQSEGALP